MESVGDSFGDRPIVTRRIRGFLGVLLFSLFLGGAVSAQESFPAERMISPPASGARSDSAPAPMSGQRSVGTTLAALGVILLIGLGLLRLWQTRAGEMTGTLPEAVWEPLGSAPIDARFRVRLFRLGTRVLVLGESAQSLETLAEISDPDEVSRLVALCQSEGVDSSHGGFRELYQQFVQRVQVGSSSGHRSETPRG